MTMMAWPENLFKCCARLRQAQPERMLQVQSSRLYLFQKTQPIAPSPHAPPISIVDVDRLDTWSRYRAGLCDTCAANCCTMPLEVQLPDLVRLGLVDAFEAEHEEPRQIAKRLQKARLIDHFNHKNVVFTMARRASGDCNFLDPKTRLCTVYDQRPETCRLHPQKKSPKPGYCAYGRRGG